MQYTNETNNFQIQVLNNADDKKQQVANSGTTHYI
jgi:hypothetical protein